MITEQEFLKNLLRQIRKEARDARTVLRNLNRAALGRGRTHLLIIEDKAKELGQALEGLSQAVTAAHEAGRQAGIAEERARWDRATYNHPEDRPGI